METNSSFRTRAYYCFVEWQTTCSNLDESALKLHGDDRNAASLVKTFLLLTFLVLGFLVSFFSTLGGAPRIDLPLSKFSLAISVLASSFLELSLSVDETNIIVLDEAIPSSLSTAFCASSAYLYRTNAKPLESPVLNHKN